VHHRGLAFPTSQRKQPPGVTETEKLRASQEQLRGRLDRIGAVLDDKASADRKNANGIYNAFAALSGHLTRAHARSSPLTRTRR
jgi:hypothetical protein